MNLTVGTPVRVLALVGLVLVLAGGGLMLVERSPSTPAPSPAPAHRTHTTAAAPKHAPARHKTTPAHTKPHAAAKTKAETAAPAKKAHRGNLVDARLPAQLQWALSRHKIVVVALYDPKSDVDAISVAEAHAGAVDAGAGFLLVNVLNDKVAGLLTGLLPGGGLLPDPGVLIYRAPGTVAFRLDGFNDRRAVAQAATNAAAGQSGPAPASTTP